MHQENRIDRYRWAVLAATLFGAAIVYSFRLTSFLHAKEAVLCLGLCAAAAGAGLGHVCAREGLRAILPLWVLVAVSALVHLAVFPARVRTETLLELCRWSALLLTAGISFDLLRERRGRHRLHVLLSASAVAVAALALTQYAGLARGLFPAFPGYDQPAYSVFGNQDLLGGYLAVALPLLVRFSSSPRRRTVFCSAVGTAVVAAGLVVSGSRSAWLAAAVGVAALFVFRLSGTRHRRMRAAAPLVLVCIMGVVLAGRGPIIERVRGTFGPDDAGGRFRLWFWDGGVRMVRAHGVLGVGPGNYAYWSPRYQGDALWAQGGERHRHNEVHTLHAHCDPLELVAETGLPGALCALWMLWRLLRGRGPEWSSLLALIVFALFNFPARSAPHALAGLLLAASLMARQHSGRETQGAGRVSAWAVILPAALLTVVHAWCVVVPSYLLRQAQDVHLADGDAEPLYRNVIACPVTPAKAHEGLGIALMEQGRYGDARAEFKEALAGLDTGGIYQAIGAIEVVAGRWEAARRALDACVLRWPDNADAWALLVRATVAEGLSAKPVLAKAARWLNPEEMETLRGGCPAEEQAQGSPALVDGE